MQENNSVRESTPLMKLWTVDEAAAFLNISSGTLYHWVSEMRVPCMHLGKRCLRFDPQQMKQWAASFGQSEIVDK
jgi:excisionase family DNA binding protein